MTNNHETRPYIDPMYRYKFDTSVTSAERLKVVSEFLKRDELANLSPLEIHIVEQALGRFLKEGKIGIYGGLNLDAHTNPPERIYMDDDDDQKDDVRRTMLGLEEKGIIILNEDTAEYTFGTIPHQDESK